MAEQKVLPKVSDVIDHRLHQSAHSFGKEAPIPGGIEVGHSPIFETLVRVNVPRRT